jgi:hypothetical protein
VAGQPATDEYDEYEDFEDEDDSEDPDEYDLEVQAVNQALEEFGRRSYSAVKDLTAEDWQALGELVHEHGISAEQAFEALKQEEAEADFSDLVERVQVGEGRQLTETELYRLAELDEQAELQGEDDVDVTEVLHDLDTAAGREAYMAERLAVEPERAEASGVLDDGEDSPSFNYDNRDEREAAIDAALSGESVSVHDSSDITEGDD